MKHLLISAALAAALAACTATSESDNLAESNAAGDSVAGASAVPPAPETGNLEVAEGNLSTRDPDNIAGMPLPPGEGAESGSSAAIPAQYRGRWGMVPADCTSTRGDAKGLIAIDRQTVRFYESVATLKEQRPAIATSFSGLFGFTGEGQTWQKVMTFTRTGDTLKRAEEDGSYTYKRC